MVLTILTNQPSQLSISEKQDEVPIELRFDMTLVQSQRKKYFYLGIVFTAKLKRCVLKENNVNFQIHPFELQMQLRVKHCLPLNNNRLLYGIQIKILDIQLDGACPASFVSATRHVFRMVTSWAFLKSE